MTPFVARPTGLVGGRGSGIVPSPGVVIPAVALREVEVPEGLREIPPVVCEKVAPVCIARRKAPIRLKERYFVSIAVLHFQKWEAYAGHVVIRLRNHVGQSVSVCF